MNNLEYTKKTHIDKISQLSNPMATPKYEMYESEATISKIHDNSRMLDSRMTEEDLYFEKEDPTRVNTSTHRNLRTKNNVMPNILLNNSYDNIKQKNKKRVNTTHRKELVSISKTRQSHAKQRSISTRSNRNKISRVSRAISESGSER